MKVCKTRDQRYKDASFRARKPCPARHFLISAKLQEAAPSNAVWTSFSSRILVGPYRRDGVYTLPKGERIISGYQTWFGADSDHMTRLGWRGRTLSIAFLWSAFGDLKRKAGTLLTRPGMGALMQRDALAAICLRGKSRLYSMKSEM